jgi:hypothetical protein
MGESRPRHDHICDTAKRSIGNFEVKDLARQMGDERIGRGQVNPRAGKSHELADDVGRAEGGIEIVERRNQGQRLGLGLGEGLGVRVEDGEDAVVEVVVGNWAGEHIILAMVSRGPCISAYPPGHLRRDLGHAGPVRVTHRGSASTRAGQCRRQQQRRPCLPSSPCCRAVSGRVADMLGGGRNGAVEKLRAAGHGGVIAVRRAETMRRAWHGEQPATITATQESRQARGSPGWGARGY